MPTATTTPLLNCVPDPMVIVSADAVILSANKAFAALCGTAGEQVEGRAMWQAMGTPEAEWRDIVGRCCRTSGSLPFAAHFRNSRGELLRCRVQGTLLEHGPVKSSTTICLRVVPHIEATQGFQKLNAEIVSLKREFLARESAEETLRDSEERFRTMADNISQFAWMADAAGSISWYNRRWYEYTGTTLEAMQGWGWEKVHHPEHVDRVVARWRRSLATGEPWEDTFPLRGRDGTYHWFLSRALPIRDADGRINRWFGTNTDITELRDTQASLRLSEARYQHLIQALPAAVYTCDEKGRVTLYNQAAVALWGREPEIGKDLWCGSWKIYRPDGTPLPLDECPMAMTLREGRAVRGEEIVIERPDGTRRHVLPQPEPIRNAEGAVVGAVSMLIDITDLKRSEQALANLAAIVTSSDDAIISKNLQGIVTSWNRSAERLYGYAAEEMIGQPVSRLIPPDRQNEESQILARIMRGEAVEHYETIRRRKDGTDLHISLTVSPMVDSRGKVIGASKIARDITQQKRTEEALRRSEQELSEFFDNASIGLHWVGPDGIILRVNRAELDLLGYSRDEYVGHHIGEFHVDAPVIQDILGRLTCGETLREYPAKLRCKDGSIREVLINSNVLFENDRFVHTRCFTNDITERKRAEEALLRSREELRRALEFEEAVVTSMGEGLYTVDDQGLVTSVNAAAENLFGWTREELLGRKMHDLTHYKHRDGTPFPAGECAGLQVLRDGKTLANHEDVFVRKDGTCFDVVYSSSPIRAGGRITGLAVVFRDVSDQKRAVEALQERDRALTVANETLRTQTAALAEANKELESFSYSVSHDLRAPLRTIDAFSRIVLDDHGALLDAEAHRCLNIVRKAASQAGELIDDLLELSRLGRQSMQVESVDMRRLAEDESEELRLVQQDRTIRFLVGNVPPAQGDRRLLKLAWSNLIGNAIKYTKYREEATIEIGWLPDESREDMAVYYVKDNGVGFDIRYVNKLFGVFQRLHRQEEFEGTGVGLAIVHRVIHRHGGRVWAEGKVDGGATFYFALRKATT